jgi:hypothetical protein
MTNFGGTGNEELHMQRGGRKKNQALFIGIGSRIKLTKLSVER